MLGFVIGRSFWNNFIFAIGITVALIPEGLLPTMTLSLAMAGQRMARRKALIKTLTSVETLGAVTVICTDKTGTLTQNKMSAVKIYSNNMLIDVNELKDGMANKLLRISYFCNNARFIDGQYKGDPTEIALLKLAKERIGDLKAKRLREFPFDPDRKRMTTVNMFEDEIIAFTKGAIEGLLPLCNDFIIGDRKMPFDEYSRRTITDACHSMMDMGLRVLAFAYKDAGISENPEIDEVENNMTFAGLIGLEDPPRPEVKEAIEKCNEAGIKIIMITGDSSRTAVAISREIGLIKGNPIIIEGHEFNKMSDKELIEKLKAEEIIFTRMTPKHKLRVVSLLKEEGEIVAVTGDGVNDEPALKKADIGLAMGITGTDVAKEAADIILLDDNFATIVNAVEEGRTVFDNIKKFITYIFASNIPEAVPYLAYILFKIPLPLTIIQILAVDLGTDMLPALALGAE